jgi:hypothetical protein
MQAVDINPYQPPTDFAADLAGEPAPLSGPRTRPIGIWILSGLHLLAGLFFAFAVVLFLQLWERFEERLMEGFLWFVVLVAAVMAAVGLSSGVGLWLGTRWGWWIASFYYVWALLGFVAEFMTMAFRFNLMDTESLAVVVLGKVIQLVIHALLLAYLLKPNVRTFCRLQSLRVDRALIPLVVIAVVLLAVAYYWTSTRFPDAF